MGYTTEFRGSMRITPTPAPALVAYLGALASTRRMRRQLDEIYGVEGEFFVEGVGFMGQQHDPTVLDGNQPPRPQPGLWLQWVVQEAELMWDESEKFYEYVPWLVYVYREILYPLGYRLDGTIEWRGEEWEDTGVITADGSPVLRATGYPPQHCATPHGTFVQFYHTCWLPQYAEAPLPDHP